MQESNAASVDNEYCLKKERVDSFEVRNKFLSCHSEKNFKIYLATLGANKQKNKDKEVLQLSLKLNIE